MSRAATAAANAAAEEAAAAQAAEEAARAATASATAQAVAVSRRPVAKPRNFRASVESALAAAIAAETLPAAAPVAPVAAPAAPSKAAAAAAPAPEELDEPEPTSVMPRLPTSASVAKQATEKNAIKLGDMNLIGVYGSSSNRRALVRMPNGKFVKVSVGDRLDGGKVTAIGEGQLTYQKGSRAITIKLLKGS